MARKHRTLANIAGYLGGAGDKLAISVENTQLIDSGNAGIAENAILIGAVDNNWTLRPTQALRYRLEVDHPPGQKETVASIVDAVLLANDSEPGYFQRYKNRRLRTEALLPAKS
jgi:hypothetical protein